MIAVSLAALCVFMFGAYAYGATVVLALKQASPVWRGRLRESHPNYPNDFMPATLILCVVSTVWFVLQAFYEFGLLIGDTALREARVPDIARLLLTFAYPPMIMHTVLEETECQSRVRPGPTWRYLVFLMYAVATGLAAFILLAAYDYIPRPRPFQAWIGISVGGLFTLCSIYCVALMQRRHHSTTRRPEQRGLSRAMVWLFLAMIALFFVLTFMREQRLLIEILDRAARTMPLAFLVVSFYYESRFDFYDLIVKRGVMLVLTFVGICGFLFVVGPWVEVVQPGPLRFLVLAVALVPVIMLVPPLHAMQARWLDIMWFGRQFTPVEAVKHVLSAMQPATDEASLVAVTEARLTEMFSTPVRILLEDQPLPANARVEAKIESLTPVSGTPVRVAVLREPSSRVLLSEDVTLLRSLAGVFGFMLENVRLQRRRQEQEQMAQELQLQTSRSELKALRAQINPHFLFNALNAIASLIHTDPARADAAVEQLAEVFRYTLRRSDQEWAPLDQELAFARAYLDVEQARFGQRLSVSIESDPVARRAQVPAMLLQTLVENAVKHGVSRMRGPARIDVRVRSAGDRLTVEVHDTGPGPGEHDSMPAADGESFGLRSVRDRLQGHFGTRASLELTRENGVTVARIQLPLVMEEAIAGRR